MDSNNGNVSNETEGKHCACTSSVPLGHAFQRSLLPAKSDYFVSSNETIICVPTLHRAAASSLSRLMARTVLSTVTFYQLKIQHHVDKPKINVNEVINCTGTQLISSGTIQVN